LYVFSGAVHAGNQYQQEIPASAVVNLHISADQHFPSRLDKALHRDVLPDSALHMCRALPDNG